MSEKVMKKVAGPKLSQWISILIWLVCIVIAIATKTDPSATLTLAGLRALLIFVATIALIVTSVVPMTVAALLGLMMMGFTGVFASVSKAWASASGSVLVNFIVILALSAVLRYTTIPERLAAFAIRISKGNSKIMILFILEACTLLSAVMTNIGAVNCFLGVVIGIVAAQRGKNQNGQYKNMARCLMIGLPTAAALGGSGTPVGSGGGLAGLALCTELLGGKPLTFAQWTLIALPIVLIGMAGVWLVLTTMWKPEPLSDEAKEFSNNIATSLGPWTRNDKITGAVMLFCVVFWLLGSWVSAFTTQVIGLIGITILLFPGIQVMTFKEMSSRMNWDIILMVAFMIGAVSGLTSSGATQWLIDTFLLRLANLPIFIMIFMMLIVGTLLHIPMISASALCTLLAVPYAMLLQSAGHVNPYVAPIICAFCSSSMYLCPIDLLVCCTYPEGHFTTGEFLRVGIIHAIMIALLTAALMIPLANLIIPM